MDLKISEIVEQLFVVVNTHAPKNQIGKSFACEIRVVTVNDWKCKIHI